MAATLLKGQILKVLSRFAKDVDANQIKFSSLSQANLSDLVLNEEVLSNVLELPVWIKLSRAVCNRVSIQIPWTHLNSQPIRINLDEVYVDMETCAELRPFSDTSATATTEMAVDGMLVTVNTVEINFRAPGFHANIQVNRIKVFSTTPDYAACDDLRMTRLKDESRDAVLVFKCVSWQTVRIEAASGSGCHQTDGLNRSSIRLITSAGQARIALKKHISTCELMASRLQILMDDLLWVLTPSQLKAALSVLQELQALASTADSVVRTKKAARKLKSNAANRPKRPAPGSASAKIAQYFDQIDIIETSYHFHLAKLNLHICDESRGQQATPPKYEDAAILIEVDRLKLDYYPYHIPSTTRRHWLAYREPDPHFVAWQGDILGDYLHEIEKHIPDLNINPLQYLMYAILIFHVEDFRVNNMTTIRSQKSKHPKMDADYPLCCSLKKALHLPKHCAAFHLEYIVNYYPHEVPVHAPPHIMHLFCNPVQVTLDLPTLDWFTLVCAEMFSTKENESPLTFSEASIPEVVCRCELLLPKAVAPVELPESAMRDQSALLGLQMQCGKLILTNTQTGRDRSLAQSLASVNLHGKRILTPDAAFPSNLDDPDMNVILAHLTHLSRQDIAIASALWSITADPVWVEFVNLQQDKGRPVAFVEPFPVCVWMLAFEEPAYGKVVCAFADITAAALKLQSTNDGYNVQLRSLDLILKVFDSLMLNCKDIFAEAAKGKDQQPGMSVLLSAVVCLPRLEFTMLIDATERSGSVSSEPVSDSASSQRPNSADNVLTPVSPLPGRMGRASMVPPPPNSVSLRDDFTEFLPRNFDPDAVSMRSVRSESSMADLGSTLGLEDLAVVMSVVGSFEDPLLQTPTDGRMPLMNWTPRSPVLSDKNVRLVTVELGDLDVVFASWKNTVFTKLTCGDINLRPPPVEGPGTLNGDAAPPADQNKPQLSLRFHSEAKDTGGPSDSLLVIQCQDCILKCPVEASAQMGTFFKTDMVGEPMPLLLTLQRFAITVSDDQNGLHGKASSGVRIQDLTCVRGKDGIFSIEPQDTNGEYKQLLPKGLSLPTDTAEARILFLKQKQSLIAQEIRSLQDQIHGGAT
ncbi:UHRF1-binding protein 1-like [Hypsibius exemplaris]|uniref:UHRF1-binding protein 1-like n=1 Tax=Hypsibius exemplaris TaxID=2072580 RepID=A0A1W0WL41_HYPEX|nr:UHRF1-binding protein 1-like [Hypsibius exemplaris]